MKQRKWMKLAVSICLMFSLLVGCSNSKEAEGNKEKKTFAFLSSTMNNAFMAAMDDSLRECVESDGDKYITFDAQNDQETQLSQFSDAVAQGVDFIFLLAVESDGVRSGLLEAENADIPVLCVDNKLNEDDMEKTLGLVIADNYNAGKICGEEILKDYPNGCKLAIIDSPTMDGCVDRADGFFDALGDNKEKFDIAAQQDGYASLEKSMSASEDILQANADVDAFFCINDPSSLGAVAALEAAGIKGVDVYGVDGSPDGKSAIEKGTITVSVAQSPTKLMQQAYACAEKYFKGEKFDREVLIETFAIDKDNVEEYGTDGWQ